MSTNTQPNDENPSDGRSDSNGELGIASPIFEMDGSEHFIEADTGCCGSFGELCECGGLMHYQPVYGGYYYKCEKCLKEKC